MNLQELEQIEHGKIGEFKIVEEGNKKIIYNEEGVKLGEKIFWPDVYSFIERLKEKMF
jgi:hypothetical protein